MSTWLQAAVWGACFVAFEAAFRWYACGRWGEEIQFKRPSIRDLRDDLPRMLAGGVFFGIGSAFRAQAFHGAPLVVLLSFLTVFVGLVLIRRRRVRRD